MALIRKDCIDKIEEDTDIVQVVSQFVELKKKGANYFGLSPFAKEKTPSFSVSPSKQIFKDFSTGKGGNAVTFVMEKTNCNYPEAIEYLAKLANVQIEYENNEQARKAVERKEKIEALRPLLKAALRQYQKAFANLPEGHPARTEVARRGYNNEDIITWQIGYAPGKDYLYKAITEKGLQKEARHLGLIGDQYDKYWDRLVYPIYDQRGLLVGMAGRDLSGKKEAAKWINPRDSEVYRKEKIWYGLSKAREAISQAGEAWIVEGYNDVIAWHKHGLPNTVAGCGTNITLRQIQLLRRYTGKIVLAMDGDKAGHKATVKTIPLLIGAGYRVQVATLPDCDPDDYCRNYAAEIAEKGLPAMLSEPDVRQDGFRILLDYYITGKDELDMVEGLKMLTELISVVEDEPTRDIYSAWLAKASKRKPTFISKMIKEKALSKIQEANHGDAMYQLPKEVTTPLENVRKDIERYGLFQSDNRIYMQMGEAPPYTFRKLSNFSIEIIQHMQDEKFPMKLLRIKNVHGKEKIFDTLSDNINSPMQFQNVLAGHGNFFWKGGRNDHLKLLELLFDKMGDGEKIDVLGWHRKGFWVLNNKVLFPDGAAKDVDENGVFKVYDGKKETCYYVPSANALYLNNPYKYDSQKKVVYKGNASLTFLQYTSMMHKVHREHAITGILFTVASIFQDIVVQNLGNFPIVFLYGPPSTGKDQMIECCQSFFGNPQTAINLEGGASTAKAQIREFAQFSNMIGHLSEYKKGDSKLDGILKGMWDRRGYKRGTIDSHVSSESIPVLSSVYLTGNDYPDNDALITRIIAEEMTVQDFTPEQIKNYDSLKEMYQSGVSHLLPELIKHREEYATQFREKHKAVSKELKANMKMMNASARMISNLAVLGATYEVLKDQVTFPFAWKDIVAHLENVVERQLRKLNSSGSFSKFWDLFLALTRAPQFPLRNNMDFAVRDDRLYFNMRNTYARIAPLWYRQYNEQAPTKARIQDMLTEATDLDWKSHKSFRYDSSRTGKQTSAHSVILKPTMIEKDLLEAIEWQERMIASGELKAVPGANDAPDLLSQNNSTSSEPQDKLPF